MTGEYSFNNRLTLLLLQAEYFIKGEILFQLSVHSMLRNLIEDINIFYFTTYVSQNNSMSPWLRAWYRQLFVYDTTTVSYNHNNRPYDMNKSITNMITVSRSWFKELCFLRNHVETIDNGGYLPTYILTYNIDQYMPIKIWTHMCCDLFILVRGGSMCWKWNAFICVYFQKVLKMVLKGRSFHPCFSVLCNTHNPKFVGNPSGQFGWRLL